MINYQLYSSRNFPPLGDTLRMISEAGYYGAEGYGGLYADKAGLAALAEGLNTNGLSMHSGHFGLAQVEETPDWALEVAQTLGMKQVIVPFVMPADRPTDAAGWKAFGARLQKAGEPIRAAGLDFGWHNHDFEFVATADNVLPQTAIFDGGPDLKWEMDVAWVVRGGADPIAWIKAYSSRIVAAHVKDIAPAGQNLEEDGWADVGHGTIDWPAIMAALKAIGVDNFVCEHDNPSDHKRFATRALASVKSY